MQRKRPFFLLEIVIAIFLVGLFSAYFLRSSIHCLYRERSALLDLEFEKEFDLKRMDILTASYAGVADLPTEGKAKEFSEPFSVTLGGKSYSRTKKFKIYVSKQHEKYYDLILQEDKEKYHFLVNKSEAKT